MLHERLEMTLEILRTPVTREQVQNKGHTLGGQREGDRDRNLGHGCDFDRGKVGDSLHHIVSSAGYSWANSGDGGARGEIFLVALGTITLLQGLSRLESVSNFLVGGPTRPGHKGAGASGHPVKMLDKARVIAVIHHAMLADGASS